MLVPYRGMKSVDYWLQGHPPQRAPPTTGAQLVGTANYPAQASHVVAARVLFGAVVDLPSLLAYHLKAEIPTDFQATFDREGSRGC